MKKMILGAALSLMAGMAWAFPTWMGVYGNAVRHTDAQNPGEFTVLLNNVDGALTVTVGIQVDAGSWTEYKMSYDGLVNTDTRFVYRPPQAFPSGATVKYYFHASDGAGQDLWDSNGGKNYSFVAADVIAPVWDSGVASPAFDDLAAAGDRLFGVGRLGSTGDLYFATRLVSETNWRSKILVSTTSHLASVRIAVRDSNILVSFIDQYYASNRMVRSTDGGATFGPVVALPFSSQLIGLEARNGTEFLALLSESTSATTAELRFTRSLDAGATWSSPSVVASLDFGGAYGGGKGFVGGNSNRLYVAYTVNLTDGRAFGSGSLHVAESVNGSSWSSTELAGYDITRGNGSDPALHVTSDGAIVALGATEGAYPNVGPSKVWRKSASGWTSVSLDQSGTSTRIYLAPLPGNGLVLLSGGIMVKSWTSLDGGASFFGPVPVPPPAGISNMWSDAIAQTVGSAKGVHTLWVGTEYVPGVSYSNKFSLVSGVLAPPPVKWVGNTYNWPADGLLTAADSLWINTESWPKGTAKYGIVVYKAGTNAWAVSPLNKHGVTGHNDAWHADLGKFPAGTTIEYAVAAIDGADKYVWDSNKGQNYKVTVKSAQPVYWVGNTYHWPFNGQITKDQDLWINTESWPKGAGVAGMVVYSTDNGTTWKSAALNKNGANGNNDKWHANLGKFASAAVVRYALMVQDANGKQVWDNHGGKDYRAAVNP